MKPLKTIKDPVHGFINIEHPLVLWLLDHPYFQRLRRIRQLGVSDFVYPGALHTRFHHALGALSLMKRVLQELRQKGHAISAEEAEAAQVAILLHDVGHGPFSHVLEHTILPVHHEQLSLQLMQFFNREQNGRLDMALAMFRDTYHRRFFHQLISSQLDMDRLDYLQRDCFFTGVSEGNIGVDRILKVINVVQDQIVIHEKGIYNIEHFLNARRMMYWQVYLHKTNVGTEQLLTQAIRRARYLLKTGNALFATPAFRYFLTLDPKADWKTETVLEWLPYFVQLDDYDIWTALKVWADEAKDPLLRLLATSFTNRNLFRTQLSDTPFPVDRIRTFQEKTQAHFQLSPEEVGYLVRYGEVSNAAYLSDHQIQVLQGDGSIRDLAEASDLPNIRALMQPVKKYFLWYPKPVSDA